MKDDVGVTPLDQRSGWLVQSWQILCDSKRKIYYPTENISVFLAGYLGLAMNGTDIGNMG